MRSIRHHLSWLLIILALFFATGEAYMAMKLLIHGQEFTLVEEAPAGGVKPYGTITHGQEPYPVAIVPLAAPIVIAIGLLTRKMFLAWSGLGLLVGFCLLFLFSSGTAFLPGAGVLTILLVFIQVSIPLRRSQ